MMIEGYQSSRQEPPAIGPQGFPGPQVLPAFGFNHRHHSIACLPIGKEGAILWLLNEKASGRSPGERA
jgi:hypothetical protein